MPQTSEGPGWPEETIPVLRVTDAQAAIDWYRRLGFSEEWQHRFEPGFPIFASLRRGDSGHGERVFLSEHTGDAPVGGLLYLRVADVTPIATEFGAPIEDLGGRLEIHLVDPDGNRIRVGSRTATPRAPGYSYPGDTTVST
jgi:catechol 2,3-dioxygenase-like lactoylglutathione lyase family enzyme